MDTEKKTMSHAAKRKMDAAGALIDERTRAADRCRIQGDVKGEATANAEKSAAERALARLLDEYDVTGTNYAPRTTMDGPSHLWNPGAWEGVKCTRDMRFTPAKDIAKLIREDIKAARKISQRAVKTKADEVAIKDPLGDAPKEIKISVRTEGSAVHAAIEVAVYNIPSDWGFVAAIDDMGYERDIPTPALREFLRELEKIHDAYNYNNSDSMTDYFERNYWGGVGARTGYGGTTRWPTRESAYYRYSKPGGGPVD